MKAGRRSAIGSCLVLAALSQAPACSPQPESATQAIRQALQGTIPAAGGTVTGTTSGNSQFQAVCANDSNQTPEHVYTWTPVASGMATISTCGAGTLFDTALYVSTAADGSGQFRCNDQTYSCDTSAGEDSGSKVDFFAVAGTTYYLYVDGNNPGQQGNYSLTVVPPPIHGVIPPGGGTISGVVSGASTTSSSSCGGEGYPENVYEWTPAVSGPANFSTCGSTTHFDTVVYVRKASDGEELRCQDDLLGTGCLIAGGLEGGTNLTLDNEKSVVAGVKYLVYVDASYEIGDGAYNLTVAPSCSSAAQCSDDDPCTTDSCSAGLCAHGPVDATCAAAHPTTVQLDVRGYSGAICISGVGCATDELKPFTLARGIYTITALNNADDAGSWTIARVKVNPGGTLSDPDGVPLGYHFEVNGNTLKVKTIEVTAIMDDYAGVLAVEGVGYLYQGHNKVALLHGRKYVLQAIDTAGDNTTGVNLSSAPYGLTVNVGGTAISLDDETKASITASGLFLTPKVAEVILNADGYPGLLGISGVGYLHQGQNKLKLLHNRKYSLQAIHTLGDGPAGYNLSRAPYGLTVNLTGTAVATDEDTSPTVLATGLDLILTAQTAPVHLALKGYAGVVAPDGTAYVFHQGHDSTKLLKNRKYSMRAWYSDGLEFTGVEMSRLPYGFTITQGGAVEVDGDTGRSLTPTPDGAELKISHVRIDPNGYAGPICIENIGCVQGAPGTLDLMAGRRYAIQGTGGTLSVVEPDSCSTSPSPLTIAGHSLLIQCHGDVNIVAVEVKRQLGGGMTAPVPGASVDMYQGSTHVSGAVADANGVATLFLPAVGPYRFHTEWWGADFWSSTSDDCSPFSCPNRTIDVSGVAVTVVKPGYVPAPLMAVNAYSGGPPWSTWAGSAISGSDGIARVGLPANVTYRFQTPDGAASYWSDADCTVAGCSQATIKLGCFDTTGLDDGNPCTEDRCDPLTGTFLHDPAPLEKSLCAIDSNLPPSGCNVGSCQEGACNQDAVNTPNQCLVAPVLYCVAPYAGGSHIAILGHQNTSGQTVELPAGSEWNKFIPANVTGSRPSSFGPSSTPARGSFSVVFQGDQLSWTLGLQTLQVSASAPTTPTCTQEADEQFSAVWKLANGDKMILPPDPAKVLAESVVSTGEPGVEAAGPTPGHFEVTHDGAASYTVPLWVPEGKGGLKPNLALVYNSRDGGGVVGVGWTLAGVSEIRRCPKDYIHWGTVAPITFSNPSPLATSPPYALCLDGKLLRPDVAGREPASYYVDDDPRIKVNVVSYDTQGPVQFRVQDGDGRTLTYGGTQNSRLEGQATQIIATTCTGGIECPIGGFPLTESARLAWSMSRIEDAYSNRLDFTYSDLSWPADSRPHYLTQIDYVDGLTNQSRRRIEFFYQARPDFEDDYVAGMRLVQNARLYSIDMYAPNPVTTTRVRHYGLKYGNTSISGRSQLTEVSDCDGQGICKSPLKFEYEPGNLTFTRKPLFMVPNPPFGEAHDGQCDGDIVGTGDFDNDGKDDILLRKLAGNGVQLPWNVQWTLKRGDTRCVAISSLPRGLVEDANGNVGFNATMVDPIIVDVDADGVPEVGVWARAAIVNGQWRFGYAYHRWNGADFQQISVMTTGGYPVLPPSNVPAPFGNLMGNWWADMNGDGRSDTIYTANSQLTHILNSSTIPGQLVVTGGAVHSLLTADPFKISHADLYGKGALDLVVDERPSGPLGARVSALSDSGTSKNLALNLLGTNYLFIDANGDGVSDILEYSESGHDAKLWRNNGTGSFYASPEAPIGDGGGGLNPAFFSVTDVDQDGQEDLVLGSGSDNHRRWLRFKPDGSFETKSLTLGDGQNGGYNASSLRPIDINGDSLTDYIENDGTAYIRDSKKPDLMIAATDSLGHRTDITHTPLGSGTHTPADPNSPQCRYPIHCLRTGLWTVTNVHRSVAVPGAPLLEIHSYAGAREGLGGHGWIGMASHSIFDPDTLTERTVEFDNFSLAQKPGSSLFNPKRFAFAGRPKVDRTRSRARDGSERKITTEIIYENEVVPASTKSLMVMPTRQCAVSYESALWDSPTTVNDVLASTCTTFAYDAYGNRTYSDTITLGGESTTTTETYDNWTDSRWILGVRKRTTTVGRQASMPSRPPVTRTVGFQPDEKGGIKSIFVEPDAPIGSTLQSTTTFDRTPNGQMRQVTVKGSATAPWPAGAIPPLLLAYKAILQTRTTEIRYNDGADGVFPSEITNALGHAERPIYHPGLGVQVGTIDPNGVLTAATVDGLGRIRSTTTADGDRTELAYYRGTGDRPLSVASSQLSSGVGLSHYDQVGRLVEDDRRATRERWAKVFTKYNSRGLVEYVSAPTYGQAVESKTQFFYDPSGRVIRRLDPDNVETTWVYQGRKTTKIDGRGIQSEVLVDDLGRTSQTTRGDQTTAFAYGEFGLPIEITVPGNHKIKFGYDMRGRRTSVIHPDAGTSQIVWNSFGEQVHSMSQDHHNQTNWYDILGRVTSTVGVDGATKFTYDLALNGLGRLWSSTSFDGVETELLYDSAGRAYSKRLSLPGENTLSSTVSFDAVGRVGSVEYPAVPGRAPFKVDYAFAGSSPNALLRISRGGAQLWGAEERSPWGFVTQEIFGNRIRVQRTHDESLGLLKTLKGGFVSAASAAYNPEVSSDLPGLDGAVEQDIGIDYDGNRNVKSRTDGRLGISETFVYDPLDRLEEWIVNKPGGNNHVSYAYDPLGNLTGRSGVGQTYEFPHTGSGNGGPHTISELKIAGTSQGGYSYDPRGNQTAAPGRTVDFAEFGLPKKITRSGSPGEDVTFRYDAFQRRVRKTGSGRDVLYFGDLYERRTEVDPGDPAHHTVKHVFHVMGEGRALAQVVWTETGPGTVDEAISYLHDDHLGSVEMVTGATGSVPAHVRFDPFGRTVQPADPAVATTTLPVDLRRGFTGHQHDDELGLINMGGRIYDPVTAHFLSADPYASPPGSGQAYNAYAYVGQNPMTFSDPSGFLPWSPWNFISSGPGSGSSSGPSVGLLGRGCVGYCGRLSGPEGPRSGQRPPSVGNNGNPERGGGRKTGEVKRVSPGAGQSRARYQGAQRLVAISPIGSSVNDMITKMGDNGRQAYLGCWQGQVALVLSPLVALAIIGAPEAVGGASLIAAQNPGVVNVLQQIAQPPGPGLPSVSVAKGAGVTLAQAIEQGLVRKEGKLAPLLAAMEKGFAAAAPRSAGEALELVQSAVQSVGLQPGVAVESTITSGGLTRMVLQNVGGIMTTIDAQGTILVKKGADVLLHLVH
jgi:RHS repeat-associated protein